VKSGGAVSKEEPRLRFGWLEMKVKWGVGQSAMRGSCGGGEPCLQEKVRG